MVWLYFLMILYIFFGLSCTYLVYAVKIKAETWFMTGIVLGILGLTYCLFRAGQLKNLPPRWPAHRESRWVSHYEHRWVA